MNPKAEPEHELTELPNQNPSSRLLDAEPPRLKRAYPLGKPNSKYQDCLKHVGLQFPDDMSRRTFASNWRSPKEHLKVATYQSRSMAALNSILHLVPMGGAICLLVLFWSRKWTDQPYDNATTLQFVAKVHEMLMQASLVTILLGIIRHQALNGYIPLGALSGAAKGPQLSYLWSVDFVSAMLSPSFSARNKTVFALSTFGLLFMTAIVGPSSAVLMIPRPGMPYERVKQTRYTNLSELEIFPSNLNYTHGLNFSKMSSFDTAQPLEVSIKDKGSLFGSFVLPDNQEVARVVKVSVASTNMGSTAAIVMRGIATVPTALSRSQLVQQLKSLPMDSLGSRLDMVTNSTLAISTLEPATLATCTAFSAWENQDVHYILHNGTTRFLSTAADMYERMHRLNQSVVDVSGWISPLWMPSPEDPASIIGVFLHIDPQKNGTRNSFAACTVRPFWWRTKAWMKSVINVRVETDLPDNQDVSKEDSFRPITIAMESIDAINTAAWLSGLATSSPPEINPDELAMLFASAISEVPGQDRSPTKDADGTIRSSCCQDDLVEGYEASQEIGGTRAPLFEFITTSYGYGYGATDTSIRLSVAVITAYCIISLLYTIYIIATGHTSIAWDSATELIMLALQSKEPKDLGHVSVGLDSMETFRKDVGIRVSTSNDEKTGLLREKLELVFKDDEETEKRGLTKVVRGMAY